MLLTKNKSFLDYRSSPRYWLVYLSLLCNRNFHYKFSISATMICFFSTFIHWDSRLMHFSYPLLIRFVALISAMVTDTLQNNFIMFPVLSFLLSFLFFWSVDSFFYYLDQLQRIYILIYSVYTILVSTPVW